MLPWQTPVFSDAALPVPHVSLPSSRHLRSNNDSTATASGEFGVEAL